MKNDKRNGKLRVALYTRISTDEDHQKYSLGAQKERLEAFCKSQHGNDWMLFKLYRDTSTGTNMKRPGLEEVLHDAEAGSFDALYVFRVDRLSRNVRQLSQMVEDLTRWNVVLKSITEPFDTSNAAGKMMLQMLGVFAEFEHETIVERTKVGMERKAKGGAFVGGVVPYGYALEPEKGLAVNESEAAIVRKMFKLYVAGRLGSSAITRELNTSGFRKRSGRPWDKRVVLHILRNPVYTGKIRWRGVVYEGAHAAIISEDVFAKAQEIVQARSAEVVGRRFTNGNGYALSGIIKCGHCKSRMLGKSFEKNGTRRRYYVCAKRLETRDCALPYVRADEIERALLSDVKAAFLDGDFLEKVWQAASRTLEAERPDLDAEISEVNEGRARTTATLNKYFSAFETGSLKPELCGGRIQELQDRFGQLAERRKALEARRESLRLPALDRDMLAACIEHFEGVAPEAGSEKQRHFFQLFVEKLRVFKRRGIEVCYRVPHRRDGGDSSLAHKGSQTSAVAHRAAFCFTGAPRECTPRASALSPAAPETCGRVAPMRVRAVAHSENGTPRATPGCSAWRGGTFWRKMTVVTRATLLTPCSAVEDVAPIEQAFRVEAPLDLGHLGDLVLAVELPHQLLLHLADAVLRRDRAAHPDRCPRPLEVEPSSPLVLVKVPRDDVDVEVVVPQVPEGHVVVSALGEAAAVEGHQLAELRLRNRQVRAQLPHPRVLLLLLGHAPVQHLGEEVLDLLEVADRLVAALYPH